MFSAVGHLFSYLLGNKKEEEELSKWNLTLEDSSAQLPWLLDIDNQQTSNYKTRCFDGKITHVFSEQGLIDGEIYFSFEALHGGNTIPKTGDAVHVIAKQQHHNGGWHAETVTITSRDWEDEDNSGSEEKNLAFIGQITELRYECGFINNNIEFYLDDCLNEYKPQKGDWVTAHLEREVEEEEIEQHTKQYAINVEPLRSWSFEGTVSAAMEDHGYIDGEVYYEKSCCLNGYSPNKRDAVKVTAIESQQGRCSWRAVSVVPLSTYRVFNYNQKRSVQYQQDTGWLVPGQKPQMFPPKTKLPHVLPQYLINNSLRNCVLDQNELTTVAPYLAQSLNMDNYVERFSTLLHLEEIQQEINIQEFDLNRVCLRKCGQYLALAVPGLAEGRPSIMIGDKILLSNPVDPDGPRYEGFVHMVTTNEVMLKFNEDFHNCYNGEDYNVQFTFIRTTLRRCHQAIRIAVKHLCNTVLFPSAVKIKKPLIQLTQPNCDTDVMNMPRRSAPRLKINLHSDSNEKSAQSFKNTSRVNQQNCTGQLGGYIPGVNSWIQSQIQFVNPCLNDRQKMAVIKILLGQSRPLPYVIFGPPGTGKTITVVESILQVYTRIGSSRILACTPSNSAADLLAERLILSGLVKTSDLVRLNAFQRSEEGIPESIEKYCAVGTDLALTSKYRIVVCTCITAGSFYILRLTAGHFTHVFVDESGQATEPECLIPLGLVAGADGQNILAGDPRQLGPVLMSNYAKMYGLDMSFLERLMSCQPYLRNSSASSENGGFDSRLITMLVDNYRSHPAILSVPSKLFYYNELKEKADPDLINKFCGWHKLPRKDFPIIFHGVKGEDVRDGGSPSWYNPKETVLVIQYLQALLQNGPFDIVTDDIGIITPYKKQVEKIRLLIDKLDVPRVKVGSVEEFQGQERPVIIISTVRSSNKLTGFDLRHTLGFLSNAKRFNVSITRAQALLIIIGNPHTLAQDPCWFELIKYCVDNGAYIGCETPSLEKQSDEDFANRTKNNSADCEEINSVKEENSSTTESCEITNNVIPSSDQQNKEKQRTQLSAADRNVNYSSPESPDLLSSDDVLNEIKTQNLQAAESYDSFLKNPSSNSAHNLSDNNSGMGMNVDIKDMLKISLKSQNDQSFHLPVNAVWCSDVEQNCGNNSLDSVHGQQNCAKNSVGTEHSLQSSANNSVDTEHSLQNSANSSVDTEQSLQNSANNSVDTEHSLQNSANNLVDTEHSLQNCVHNSVGLQSLQNYINNSEDSNQI